MQIVFARKNKESNIIREERLYINNCGYYLGLNQNMKIDRRKGRVDYHFIYVHKGMLNTNFGKVKAGECLYYQPNSAQRYEYVSEEKNAYFWVHYSGEEARYLFEGKQSGILSCGINSAQIYELFLRMVHAVQDQFFESERYALGIFQAICALICGGEREKSPFKTVISMMNDLSKTYGIADYAQKAKMSKEHFIRSFKAYTGKTPLEYRTDIIIAYTKNLLMETTLKVGVIGEMAGFSDPLYFSRVFKKRVGLSPTEFRNTINISY